MTVPVAVQGDIERIADVQKIKHPELTNAGAEAMAIDHYLAAYGESANADTQGLKVYGCLVHGIRCGDGSIPEELQVAFKLLVFDPEACTSGGVASCSFEIVTALPTPVKGLKAVKIGKYSDEFTDATKTACSFSGTTLVLMADGSTKPIEDIEPGEKVMATDPKTGKKVARTVLNVWVHWDTLTDLVLEGGGVLTTTEDHPYWSVDEQKWNRADELGPGERMLSASGATVRAEGMRWVTSRSAVAYNLNVEGIHTFHVGIDEILVHNSDTCDVVNWSAKSVKTFGHTFSDHGAGAKRTRALTDRARTTGNDQGQWLDNDAAAEFLKNVHVEGAGPHSVRLPAGMGQVIRPDGSIVEASAVLVVPRPGGVLKTAYPVVGP